MNESEASADPSGLIDLRDGIYADDLVITAVAWLDLFSWLRGHPCTRQEISCELGLSMRPLDVMITLLATMGLVREEEGAVRLTAISEEYLVGGSPHDLRPFYASQKSRPQCVQLLEVLKTGEPAVWSSREEGGEWVALMEDEAFASSFTAAMDSRGAVLAPAMAAGLPCEGYSNLLDIAGGSGIYACHVAEARPGMRTTVLEKPPVDKAARAAIAAKGLAGKVDVVGSDMFADPLPTGFDVHLWSHVLHDWDAPDVRLLLSRSFESLEPGGTIAIHDAHVNAEKNGPLAVARFSVLLMHSTRGKCYSTCELDSMLREAGFKDIGFVPTACHRSLVLARKPRT